MNEFVCPICGNSDPRLLGKRNGEIYCRKCIGFRGNSCNVSHHFPKKCYYHLDYSLSEDQQRLSNKLIENYKDGIDTLVHAVCGSGKTEIVLSVISYAITCGDTVGFVTPRRDVIIELHERFASIFKRNSVALVYGGHTSRLDGDLVCLTSHQLFRYEKHFDLLIMDEVDAFPFKGDDVLTSMFYRAIRGHFIMMSATPDLSLLETFKKPGKDIVELFSRFHMHPLPVPEIVYKKGPSLFIALVNTTKKMIAENKQIFIFTPTIEMCENTFKLLNTFIRGGYYVHSKCEDRSQRIQDFRDKKYKFLLTTAVLERGVTVKDLQVIVYHADHDIYDSYTLIQIAGRVGRKKDAPEGKVIFLAEEGTGEMDRAIDEIERANKSLQTVLQRDK